MADFRSERATFGPKRGDFSSERVDLGLTGLISGLKEPDLGLVALGGGTYGWTYGRMDGHKEIHPCVLQDIGPLGPLPKKRGKKIKTGRPRAICGQRYPLPCFA